MKNKIKSLFSFIGFITNGLLGAYGGASGTNKNWRRTGIPLFLVGSSFLLNKGLSSLILGLFGIGFGMGYGIPDENDEGSALGRFWVKLVKNKTLAEIGVRGSIGAIFGSIACIYGLVKGNGLFSFISLPLGIIAGSSALLFRKLGVFKLFGKKLLWEEFFVNGLIGLTAIIQILGG